jgi:hypothetical protein
MRNPDAVLRELGQLYDFQKELAKFRFKMRPTSNKAAAPDRGIAPHVPRSVVPGR